MNVHLFPYRNRYKAPLQGFREGVLIEYQGKWGDIAPLPGWSQETLEESVAEIHRLSPYIEEASSKLPSVQFALECLRQPWPPAPFRKPLSALTWDNTVPLGYKTVKLKVGGLTPKEAIDQVKKIQAQGLHEIRVDVNRSWSLSDALLFADHFHPNDFAYLEEPTSSFTDLIRFSELTSFPLAVDESFREGHPYQEIPTLQAVIIKPTLLGTIPLLPKGIDLILSGSYESGVGTLHIASIFTRKALGLDTYRYLEGDPLSSCLKIEQGELVWKGL